MPVDLIVLIAGIVVAVIGVIAAAVAFRRHSPGRMVQAAAIVLLPIALYFTGLLTLVVQAVAAVGTWAAGLALSPLVWTGFGLLGLAVVLWVVGGYVARRQHDRQLTAGPAASGPSTAGQKPTTARPAPAQVSTGRPAAPKPGAKGQPAPVDDDMAEIEALLKRRGID